MDEGDGGVQIQTWKVIQYSRVCLCAYASVVDEVTSPAVTDS